jgi:tRNA(Ile)-lysidine synthase
MRSSHPPTLLKIVERTIREEHLLTRGDLVLVAVSGGPDSMALLHSLARLAPRLGVTIEAHGIDHGLRPRAMEELTQAQAFAASLGVAFATTRVEMPPGANLMARAREARYRALRAALGRVPGSAGHETANRFIATGHHADDRAETVLMRLLRGAGPDGLAVLPPRSADLIRPMVRARRTDVALHIERHGIPYAEDPTNRDPRFLRTRVRSEILPALAGLSPRIVEHLCDLADALGEGRTAESGLVPAVFEGLALGKAQRNLLARALRTRNPRVRVPLPGGKIAGVDLSSRRIVLMRSR